MKIDSPVAFAHIDVDWYDPVMYCIKNISPKLILGGSMIFDDYHAWGGCRKAVDEYLRTVIGQFELNDKAGSMKITKIKNHCSNKTAYAT
jgi:asparagine synthase (glutamine-hydrolysing)